LLKRSKKQIQRKHKLYFAASAMKQSTINVTTLLTNTQTCNSQST